MGIRTVPAEVAALEGKVGAGYDGLDDNKELGSSVRGHLFAGLIHGTGTMIPDNKSLYDILGIGYIHDSGNFTHSIRRHLRRGLAGANATTVLAENKSILDAIGHSGSALLASGIGMEVRRGTGTQIPNNKGIYDYLQYLTGNSFTRLGAPAGASISVDIAAIKTETDKQTGSEYTGTVSAGTAAKTAIKEITTTSRIEIKSIWLDLTLLVTAGATIELEHKIDGVNYKVFETDSWALTDDDGVLITGFTINNDFKISITGGEAAGVSIPFVIIYQVMES
jgi:hypothetical protein